MRASQSPRLGEFDAAEIGRLMELGVKRGLIGRPDGSSNVPIAKDGFDLANLAGVKTQWMEISPAKAEHWLKNNFGNRPISDDVVVAFARDMMNGTWVPTHQGIALNSEDQLIDGQHRLKAIIRAGVTIRTMVTFGLPSKIEGREMTTMDAVDRGRTRSVADQLAIQHGIKKGGVIAAVCAGLAGLCYGAQTRRVSVHQTLEVFREFEDGVLFVIEHRAKKTGVRVTGVLAGFAFALAAEPSPRYWELPETDASNDNRHPASATARAYVALMTGENLKPGSPIQLLREFLLSDQLKLYTRSLDRGLAELVLSAILQEQRGEKIKKLEIGTGAADHFRNLQSTRVKKIAKLFLIPKPDAIANPSFTAAATPAQKHQAARATIQDILRAAEAQWGIAVVILLGRGTDTPILHARGAVIAVAAELGYGMKTIAAVLHKDEAVLGALLTSFRATLAESKLLTKKFASFRAKFIS